MTRLVAVLDYGVGNLASVANMIRRAGGTPVLVTDPGQLHSIDRIVLPGVGAFDSCREALDRKRPLVDALLARIAEPGVRLLGVCVGMQLLADGSEEGRLPGLGLVPGYVRRLPSQSSDGVELRVPHMGWSLVTPLGRSPLFDGFADGIARFYFVHSYHFVCASVEHVVGTAMYGAPFTAAVARDNVFGVQFHPEKSHGFGLRLFEGFLK